MTAYGLGYLLSGSAKAYHERLRLAVEERFNLTGLTQSRAPAHITLKYPFAVESGEREEIERLLAAYARSQVKTSWSLDGFGYFDNAEALVIFIDVIPSQATCRAHAALLDRLKELSWMQWGFYDHADLHYHVTLAARGVTADNFVAVWDFVNRQPRPHFDLSFDHLALVRIEPERVTVYRQYHFRDS
jgi:2'-5' RNA ligase